MSWIKFNNFTTPSHKAAYINQTELLMSKSLSSEFFSPISQSEIVNLKISFLLTLWAWLWMFILLSGRVERAESWAGGAASDGEEAGRTSILFTLFGRSWEWLVFKTLLCSCSETLAYAYHGSSLIILQPHLIKQPT